jgi:ribonuclease BN (tRNA processing enzyme)
MNVTCLGRYGPYPAPLGRTTSFLLQTEQTAILVDFGSGALSQLLDFIGIDRVDAILLSHLHADHISDMRVLALMLTRFVLQGKRAKLPVYLPDSPDWEYKDIASQPAFSAFAIDTESAIDIGDCVISFKRTIHPVLCYAMRIQSPNATLVYSADSVYDESLIPFIQGADVFLCDAAFTRENQPSDAVHMTSEQAAALAKRAKAGSLWLTHLNPTTDEKSLISQAKAVFPNARTVIEHESFRVGS